MTFYRWLHQQISRNDRIGDLARDAFADSQLKPFGYITLRRHMIASRACDEAMEAAKAAHAEYLQEREVAA